MTERYDCRDAFVNTLEALGQTDPRVVVVVNDSVSSSKVGGFRKLFPERVVNVGIAEQDMVGVSAGLANGGLLPFVCGASCFLTGRALEQIKVDIAYSMANVKLCGISSGVAYGELGPTHHSIEDIAWTRAIANLVVIVPSDPEETAQAVAAAAQYIGPVFLRLSRQPVPMLHTNDYHFQIGKADQLREGRDITLIANGVMVHVAVTAAERLAQEGIHARVLNIPTVRPIDVDAIVSAARDTGGIVTIEEHTIYGGLGSAVAELVVTHHPVPMRILGFPGVFMPTGSAEWLFNYFGLNTDGVCNAARELTTNIRKTGI